MSSEQTKNEEKGWIENITGKLVQEYGIFIVFLIVCVAIAAIKPVFLSLANIFNVIRQVSMIGIIAIGMTFVILSADIDLSVGSVAALTGALSAGFMVRFNFPMILGILVPIAIAGLIGVVNGLIVTKAKVHSFVVTLGMMSIARGVTYVFTNGRPISGVPRAFGYLGGGMVGMVPFPVVLFLILALIAYFVLARTPYGRAVYAIGGNKEAARLSGIEVDRYEIANFALCSSFAGLAGLILTSRVRSAVPVAAQGWELDVIAAVIIGGTSLFGGRGGVAGTLIGALFLGVLRNGANLLGVSPFYQQIMIGGLIIVAVVLDRIRRL